jgi:hypothetical protein
MAIRVGPSRALRLCAVQTVCRRKRRRYPALGLCLSREGRDSKHCWGVAQGPAGQARCVRNTAFSFKPIALGLACRTMAVCPPPQSHVQLTVPSSITSCGWLVQRSARYCKLAGRDNIGGDSIVGLWHVAIIPFHTFDRKPSLLSNGPGFQTALAFSSARSAHVVPERMTASKSPYLHRCRPLPFVEIPEFSSIAFVAGAGSHCVRRR